jgi:hypothetical protein
MRIKPAGLSSCVWCVCVCVWCVCVYALNDPPTYVLQYLTIALYYPIGASETDSHYDVNNNIILSNDRVIILSTTLLLLSLFPAPQTRANVEFSRAEIRSRRAHVRACVRACVRVPGVTSSAFLISGFTSRIFFTVVRNKVAKDCTVNHTHDLNLRPDTRNFKMSSFPCGYVSS